MRESVGGYSGWCPNSWSCLSGLMGAVPCFGYLFGFSVCVCMCANVAQAVIGEVGRRRGKRRAGDVLSVGGLPSSTPEMLQEVIYL